MSAAAALLPLALRFSRPAALTEVLVDVVVFLLLVMLFNVGSLSDMLVRVPWARFCLPLDVVSVCALNQTNLGCRGRDRS